jgi:peptidoglycan/LPS O-acetylase OafA/YrhL
MALVIGVGGVLASIVVAAIAHALVEKPARNWLRANIPSFMAGKPKA